MTARRAIFAAMGALALAGCVTETTARHHTLASEFDDPIASNAQVYVNGKVVAPGDGATNHSPPALAVHPAAPGTAAPAALPPSVAHPGASLAENNPVIDWDDPAINSMDTLVESLLLYYSLYKKLPDTLEQIPNLSPTGEKVTTTSPVNGLPYQYYSHGFELRREFLPPNIANDASFTPPLLILFDAKPAHNIKREFINGQQEFELHSLVRYGIVMDPPVQNHPIKMYIVPLDEALLNLYLKSSQHGAQPAN